METLQFLLENYDKVMKRGMSVMEAISIRMTLEDYPVSKEDLMTLSDSDKLKFFTLIGMARFIENAA